MALANSTSTPDDIAWQRRAHPLALWSRLATLPLFAGALWARAWIEAWFLALVLLLLAWMWVSPRIFPPASAGAGWTARAAFGERIVSSRGRWPITRAQRRIALGLGLTSSIGTLCMVSGAVLYDLPITLVGIAVMLIAKLAYFDRMVRIYDDVASLHEDVRSWAR